jgi:hypothetical protein
MIEHLVVKPLLQILALHPFKPLPDTFAEQADCALGPPEPLTDLPRRETLQAQFQDGAFFLVQAGEKLLDGLAQHRGFEGSRLAAKGLPKGCRRISSR